MYCVRFGRFTGIALVLLLVALPASGGFAGTDVFLPGVGTGPGVPPSFWYTTVWVHNPNATAADITVYLLERQANIAPLTYTDSIPPGDTKKYDNAVEEMFSKQTLGALRITSNLKVVVSSRIFSQPGTALEDSVGQFFPGVPASFAIGAGESTEIVGGWQTQPAESSTFRFNFGFVEVTGAGTCEVQVTVKDETGTQLGSKTYTVHQWEQFQRALASEFPAVSEENVRLTVEVLSGTGRVIAFGSSAANGSQDPTSLEMLYADDALGAASVSHDETLTGDGTASSPLGLADEAVTLPKLATTNSPTASTDVGAAAETPDASTRILGTDGASLFWTDFTGSHDLASGGVTFGGAGGNLAQDAANLFWDDAANRLGIGTTTPSEQLELTGNLKLPATTATTGQLYLGDEPVMHSFGTDNFFVGRGAGNLTQIEGEQNTGVGVGALQNLKSSWGNTAVGYRALASQGNETNQTAVGANALTLSTAYGNVAFGSSAMAANTTGIRNTAVGTRALAENTTGERNAALGFQALRQNTTASYNTAVGEVAMHENQTGERNVAVGKGALYSNVEGHGNTALGTEALYTNTADENTAVGWASLYHNTSGEDNTAVGVNALTSNTSGWANTAVGRDAMFANTTASNNTAFGWASLEANTTGANNTAVGVNALHDNVVGNSNTAVGNDVLVISTGSNNTAIGWHALDLNVSGSGNVAIGLNAGATLVSGDDNLFLAAPAGAADESGTIRVGTQGTHTRTFVQGISGVPVAGADPVYVQPDGQLGTAVPSSRRFKEEIRSMGDAGAFLQQLRPVTFRYRSELDPSGARHYGLIAEEVAEVAPELVVFSPDGEPEGVRYHLLDVLLLAELQRQYRVNNEQAAVIEELRRRVDELSGAVAELQRGGSPTR